MLDLMLDFGFVSFCRTICNTSTKYFASLADRQSTGGRADSQDRAHSTKMATQNGVLNASLFIRMCPWRRGRLALSASDLGLGLLVRVGVRVRTRIWAFVSVFVPVSTVCVVCYTFLST